MVEKYQTVVIVGSTGCGKSTQIPQVRKLNSLQPRVFPDSHFLKFYPQNFVLYPQKLEAMFLSDAHMINPKLILFIHGFVF